MSAVTVYTLKNCSTCREAVKWLRAQKIEFVEKPIRETPPTVTELRAVLAAQDGQVRKLFNTSGLEYRALKIAEQLPTLSEDDALALLARNGSLVKRPLLVRGAVGLVGFDPTEWARALG